DAAVLFRLALEKGAAGARYHGVAEEGLPFREIAEVIGRRLGLPVVGKSLKEAAAQFSWFGPFVAADNPASSRWTRERLSRGSDQPLSQGPGGQGPRNKSILRRSITFRQLWRLRRKCCEFGLRHRLEQIPLLHPWGADDLTKFKSMQACGDNIFGR